MPNKLGVRSKLGQAKLCPFSLMESLMDYHYGRCESSLKNFGALWCSVRPNVQLLIGDKNIQ